MPSSAVRTRWMMKKWQNAMPSAARKTEHDRPVQRKLELRENHVRRRERVELDRLPEILVLKPRDHELRRPEETDREDADGDEGDDQARTELPQVLRERHFLLVPARRVVLDRRGTLR
jgi:hypothetical protein